MCELFQELMSTYSWCAFGVHLLIAITMFFIINWIGKNSISVGYVQMSLVVKEDSYPAFNLLFKAIAPVVVYIIVIAIMQQIETINYVANSFMIIVYYWAIRLLWICFTGRTLLTNWISIFVYMGISSLLVRWIYNIAETVNSILPNPESLLEELWILIIVFIYSISNKIVIGRTSTIRRKHNYIDSKYRIFKRRYNEIIHSRLNDDFYEALTYSIMIYEDFNRPVLVRIVEYISFFITRKSHTLGIMQVTTNKYISNVESIEKAMLKIVSDGNDVIESKESEYYYDYLPYCIAQKYNSGDYTYADEIKEIFDHISKLYDNMPDKTTKLKTVTLCQ